MTTGRRNSGMQEAQGAGTRRGMTVSELIGRLQAIRVEFHGDPPVDCAVRCDAGETVDGEVTRLVPVLVRGMSYRIGGRIVHGRLLILSAEPGGGGDQEGKARVQGDLVDLGDRVDDGDDEGAGTE